MCCSCPCDDVCRLLLLHPKGILNHTLLCCIFLTSPAELGLGWPEQPLTVSVERTDAINLQIMLPSELGGAAVFKEVLLGHTVQHILQLALSNAPVSSMQHLAGGQPSLFAAHIPYELQPETTLRQLDISNWDVLRVLMLGAPRPVVFGDGSRIFGKTMTGKSIKLDISLDAYIGELKRLIYAVEGAYVLSTRQHTTRGIDTMSYAHGYWDSWPCTGGAP